MPLKRTPPIKLQVVLIVVRRSLVIVAVFSIWLLPAISLLLPKVVLVINMSLLTLVGTLSPSFPLQVRGQFPEVTII